MRMSKLILAAVLITAFLAPAASANMMPFQSQPKFSQSAEFQGLQKFNKSLLLNVRKGEKYSSKRFTSSKESANKKIAASIAKINRLLAEGESMTRSAAAASASLKTQEFVQTYASDAGNLSSRYKTALVRMTKKRNADYRQTKKNYLAKLNRAYLKTSQVKIRSLFQKKIISIRRGYYLGVKRLRDEVNKDQQKIITELNSKITNYFNQLKTEMEKAASALNKRTAAQIASLKKSSATTSRYLARLGGKSSVRLTDIKAPPAVSASALLPAEPRPPTPTVLGPWPSLDTPEVYLIPKNYVPKKVAQFQKNKTAEFCKAGSDYRRALSVSDSMKARVSNLERLVRVKADDLRNDRAKYREAYQQMIAKKRIFEKEQRIRLTRPDDSYLVRARNRYKESVSGLNVARDTLKYTRASFDYQKKLLDATQSKVIRLKNKAKAYRLTQKKIVNSFSINPGRTCPGLIIG